MKKTCFFLSFLFIAAWLVSCGEKHFLNDGNYRRQIREQFEKRRNEADHRRQALFSVFDRTDLTQEQREALEFLYAGMPLCDLVDYDGDFFLQQVNAAFRARDAFSWGKMIPDDVFRHFVLAYRVNNESLDSGRTVFFDALKERIRDMSMYDAALEVNHWCHEKVTYRGTDGRTSSPLALVKTSWGRCGEESTFTVAALRAVSIPARQCYTPRWVHTDDNHAWVEVWIDGKWHYMGACEPEPELDVAWFTGPAKRAMMVHTNVFGLYGGPEEKNAQTPLYATINLLGNYAATRRVAVRVTDVQDQPVEGATVKFKVYNYAELYPIAKGASAADGTASILSGNGDLVIWASKGNMYGYAKSSPAQDTVVVKLNRTAGECYHEVYTLDVPPEQSVTPPPQEKKAANDRRLAQEDSIRNAYMNTFMPPSDAAGKTSTEHQEKSFLHKAQGNWREIADFMRTETGYPYLSFLASLSDKDLRDTPADFLRDHIRNGAKADASISEDIYIHKILSPRIALEQIKPWRSFFRQPAIAREISGEQPDAEKIIEYIRRHIELEDAGNGYNCYITPRGVYELKKADRRSRNVFFVAVCRSLGIPAQVEKAAGKVQYYENGQWKDAIFDERDVVREQPKATLTLTNAASNLVKPAYDTHYTLAYFKDGDFQTLNLEGNPVTANFPYRLQADEGYYRLMTGSRADDGSVVVRSEYFTLDADTEQTFAVTLPEAQEILSVQGRLDMNLEVTLTDQSDVTLQKLSGGKGLMLCFVDVGKEPSKHVLQDLPAVRKALEEWGGGILLVTTDVAVSAAFDASVFKGLPQQTAWGIDSSRVLLQTVTKVLQSDFRDHFPLTVYLSAAGDILYSSAGYRIGMGEDILKIIRLEKKHFQ
ncbi:MAG: transglutaminase-like domain-containing protein [Bacteroidales bacterium]|jgi:transglutaminase-like putative cysteine protease|nr:transglutaminase-like domain-containing protein [Bacteroidales bacterium]